MFEIIFENIQLIAGVLILLGGTVFGMYKFHKNKVKEAFDEGVKEETSLQRIERKADKALEGVGRIEKKLDDETKRAADHHLRLYEKIEDIAEDVSFLKGKANGE